MGAALSCFLLISGRRQSSFLIRLYAAHAEAGFDADARVVRENQQRVPQLQQRDRQSGFDDAGPGIARDPDTLQVKTG